MIHRMKTGAALVAHPAVAEAAVVGYPHDIKGQGIFCYVTLQADIEPSEDLRKELVTWVRKEIGPIAKPREVIVVPGLPKTRSGKITRRLLTQLYERGTAIGEAEARAVLGVPPGASEDDIRRAWKRAMTRAHPDQGGTEGLAARVNAARDRLLRNGGGRNGRRA